MRFKMIYRGEPIKDIAELNKFRAKINKRVKTAKTMREKECLGYCFYLLDELHKFKDKKMNIRVRTNKKRNIIKGVKVDYIQDYIKSDGEQYSIAFKNDKQYKIVDRDSEGSIWREIK